MLFAGCSGADDSATSDAPSMEPGREPAAEFDTGGGDDADMAESPASETRSTEGGVPGGLGGFDLGEIGREVAVEMRVTMRSDDLRATVDGILAAASAAGGGVAATDVDYGSERRDGRATIVVKVPPRALSGLITQLDVLGEVTGIGQDAQDVTDQLTDLDVRIRNATQSVDRVRGLLSEASDLREVIDLESELTRRQTDLERLQASQRSLQERVALATVTIQVFPTAAAVEPEVDDEPGIADGFRTGWDAFVGVLFGLAYGLAVIAPILVVTLVVATVAWRIWRVRSRRPAVARRPAPPSGTLDPDTRSGDDDRAGDGGTVSESVSATRQP